MDGVARAQNRFAGKRGCSGGNVERVRGVRGRVIRLEWDGIQSKRHSKKEDLPFFTITA